MTATPPPDTRPDPPLVRDEPPTRAAYLDFHRETLRWKCRGLTQEQLAVAHPPSEMTLGGMMKHLALVESSWFEDVSAGRGLMPPFDTIDWDADRDWEWHTARDDTPEELFALFDDACRRADAGLDQALGDGAVGLDRLSVAEASGGRGRFSLRRILVHMIEEYARHNGHADLIREAIDGQTGE